MKKIFPQKLKTGDGIRVITPARSLAMPWMNEELKDTAKARFKELGLNLSFSKHVNEIDEFNSAQKRTEFCAEFLFDEYFSENNKTV